MCLPLKMKAKFVVLAVAAAALLATIHMDLVEGRRPSQLSDDCDFDFKEQPEDFYGMLDAIQVSGIITWPPERREDFE